MIQITDKYYAEADKYCWTLLKKHIVTEAEAKKRKNAVAGNIEYKNISYHMNLEQLLTSLLEKHKKGIAKECNLEKYIQELKVMQEAFIKQVKEMLDNESKRN